MVSVSDLMEAMIEAGAPMAAVVIAVRAIEAKDAEIAARDAAVVAQRVAARDKKRLQRALSRDSLGTVSGQDGDCPDQRVSPKEGPQTPKKITPSQTAPSTPSGSHGSPIGKPNGFARFWEAYPNKAAKRTGEAAYSRALKRIAGPDPPAVILAGVARAKLSRQWIDGFVPHPATWLNGNCWEDEPIENVVRLNGSASERQSASMDEAIRRFREQANG